MLADLQWDEQARQADVVHNIPQGRDLESLLAVSLPPRGDCGLLA